jgi:hypothetical protein
VPKEENTRSLSKLASSFVAGDDGRTKRREGKERERKEPNENLSQRAVDMRRLKVVVGEHEARHQWDMYYALSR